MMRKGKNYHKDGRYFWRTVTPTSGEINPRGEKLHVGEVVLVSASRCQHVMTRIRVVKWVDREDSLQREVVPGARILNPCGTDAYVPVFMTRTNAGYCEPRKARDNAPYRHIEYRDSDGEWQTEYTHDYYSLKSFWIEDGVVYTRLDYISSEQAARIMRVN